LNDVQIVNVNAREGVGTDARIRAPTWEQCVQGSYLDNVRESESREDWNEMSFSFAANVWDITLGQSPLEHHLETALEFLSCFTLPKNIKSWTSHMYGGAIAGMHAEKVINIRDVVGSEFCIGFGDGNRLFKEIRDGLAQGNHVEISFENIRSLSAAFLESAIGQLYKSEIPYAKLDDYITWIGVSPKRSLLIKRAIAEAKESKVVL
jgi:hypothetical protein